MEKTDAILARYKKVMVPNYAPARFMPIKGQGVWLEDVEGKKYLDLTGGIAVTGLGHCPPEVAAALKAQLDKVWHVSNYYANLPVVELAELFTSLTGFERAFFANSGSEAVEAALKLVRRYAHDHFGPDKNEIISFHKSFHGRTLFSVTAGGQEAYRTGFGPLPPKMIYGIYNDADDLKRLISDQCCAVIMEPVQGEGGVLPATPEFAQAVRALCDQHQALLIFDEVQSGVGRTGSLFGYQQLGVMPDVLTAAKALGSGFPIGAMLTSTKIAQVFQPGVHGSTFGGNPLAAVAAKATLEIISKPQTLANVNKRSAQFLAGLQKIAAETGVFGEVRARGLLIGSELSPPYQDKAKLFVQTALGLGLLILVAGPNVIRLAPSLLISEEETTQGLKLIGQAVRDTIKSL
ncbi:MAG: hypothetical protein A2527_00680 [Candidatus Lambdaproteobacteria bacterium RIFOXYD2_FULL_50_16]|uniref:Acetylornithine aminotransferase n=1 Tax=Candidatus Lambdaproteobacteria bacterium RIFOXYD2_FULL_50_16 TaxID=1817772 RepID=A0A1F6GF89_9PROT|nr:MAG: hypothetical protein A2527_00680 [Candidatus Lambdaproteobacteria bacterium RIFOXYD2_FULL_50_16]